VVPLELSSLLRAVDDNDGGGGGGGRGTAVKLNGRGAALDDSDAVRDARAMAM
jgi:hypothetical protein